VIEQDGTVKLGSWVQIEDGDLNEAWRIADAQEADAMRRLLSEKTPLAQALLGHRAGDRVRVVGPDGRRFVKIVRVDD
jgi:transcription elongation factor GreA